MRQTILASLFGSLIVCATCASPERETMADLTLLTRDGCVQMKIMRARLDAAINAIGTPIPYTVVNVDTLQADDARRGYPTPTILRGGVDLFGMTTPTPPYPEPT